MRALSVAKVNQVSLQDPFTNAKEKSEREQSIGVDDVSCLKMENCYLLIFFRQDCLLSAVRFGFHASDSVSVR
jgi:hypothetical protein